MTNRYMAGAFVWLSLYLTLWGIPQIFMALHRIAAAIEKRNQIEGSRR